MIHQDSLSYNLVFTSKACDLLLYIQNSRCTFALLDMALLEVEMQRVTLISPDQLDTKGLLPHKAVILRLMDDFTTRKSFNEHGVLRRCHFFEQDW